MQMDEGRRSIQLMPYFMPAAGGARPTVGPSIRALEREWGRLPNVYRLGPPMQQIREDPRVALEALPPMEDLVLAGPESHRCAACRHAGFVQAAAPSQSTTLDMLLVQICPPGRSVVGSAA